RGAAVDHPERLRGRAGPLPADEEVELGRLAGYVVAEGASHRCMAWQQDHGVLTGLKLQAGYSVDGPAKRAGRRLDVDAQPTVLVVRGGDDDRWAGATAHAFVVHVGDGHVRRVKSAVSRIGAGGRRHPDGVADIAVGRAVV